MTRQLTASIPIYRQCLRALQGVDELVDQVDAQLETAGVLDDTYVIYSSDVVTHKLTMGRLL